jgi:nucleoside 2-deoxyribosyltransferase
MSRPAVCFVAMPFDGELQYLFLYLELYLERHFNLKLWRADRRPGTGLVVTKVREQIVRCDLLLAEISSSNPNVLYEIGLAHALGKPVIMLSRRPPEEAPFDVRGHEMVTYQPEHDEQFRRDLGASIEIALTNKKLYDEAEMLLQDFSIHAGRALPAVDSDTFRAAIARQQLPDQGAGRVRQLVAGIARDSLDTDFMAKLDSWTKERFA